MHPVPERYEINVSEVIQDHRRLGKFAVGFVVEPPIKFASEEARIELASHLLNSINLIGDYNLVARGPDPISFGVLVSFTHEQPEASATVGTISGHYDEQISQEVIHKALDFVLNADISQKD